MTTGFIICTVPINKTTKGIEYTGQAIKHSPKDFVRWIKHILKKEGFHVPAEALEASFPKWAEREYLQATQQMEKRAVFEESFPSGISKPKKVKGRPDGCPGPNTVQNKQAADAFREIERKLGRKLSKKQKDEFHKHITGQNYTYQELVEEGYWLFNDLGKY